MGRAAVVRGLLLGWAVVLSACTTGTMASGGLLSPATLMPEDSPGMVFLGESRRWEPELSEARRAEAECALSQVWGLVRGMDEVGARVELRFWAHRGALTLRSHRSTGGQERAESVEERLFTERFRRLLVAYVGERTGEVVFTLHRTRTDWRVDFHGSSEVPRPAEAKTQPVRREGVAVGTYAAVTHVAGEMVRLLGEPTGPDASFTATVQLADDGVAGWEPGPHEGTGREVSRAARERLRGELIQALLPFTHGVGLREVHLTLRGVRRPGEPAASWRVVEAKTSDPTLPVQEDAELIAEYRALHETILREWREEVVDSGQWALRLGTEELAFWVIGGVAVHGGGAVLKAVAPRMMQILLKGGAKARGWLSTLLLRLPKAERETFKSLWKEVDLRGGRSLTKAEELELSKLAKRLEELVDAPLSTNEKRRLRETARTSFQQLHPELAQAMRLVTERLYEVHHRRPLEYAHLLLGEDINARNNLVAVARPVHGRINGLWTKFRMGRGGAETSAEEVKQMAEIVDRHFHHWYDVLYDSRSTSALDNATEMALKDVEKLLTKG
ncbi:hypothetical protein [Archangium sp.]|uniref:hypothetical protein n=1 Tax=Archangium sp. TaxID=1872627 RepID=UPI00286A54BD|nr:hypothetical protein [Archangium sp.]